MLPQRKNVNYLKARRSPVRSTALRMPREPIWGQTANWENFTRHAKKFSKSITICGVWIRIQQAYLDCKENRIFSVLFFTRSRSQVCTSRDDSPQTRNYVRDAYIDEDYVTNMTFSACLHACRCTSRPRIKLETQVRIAWNLIDLNESRRCDY